MISMHLRNVVDSNLTYSHEELGDKNEEFKMELSSIDDDLADIENESPEVIRREVNMGGPQTRHSRIPSLATSE